jgi:hypothetical protein
MPAWRRQMPAAPALTFFDTRVAEHQLKAPEAP